MKFHIVQSQLVFDFQANPLIRRKIFEFEEKLKDYFMIPFGAYSIPDNISPETPRFETTSLNRHSRLQISFTRLVMITGYDKEFSIDRQKIQDYLLERAKLFETLVSAEKLNYMAFVLDLTFPMKKSEINSYIKNITKLQSLNDDTIDFSMNYSFPYKDSYFLNVKISKYIAENLMPGNALLEPNDEDGMSYGVNVQIDLNSKYHFVRGNEYRKESLTELKKIIFDIVSANELEQYLTGELKYE